MKLLAPLLLALSSCASTGLVLETVPPTEDPLVEVAAMDSRIRVLAVYATPDNFVGETLYPEPRIFLRRSAMERLSRVQSALESQGVGLMVFDGYRPLVGDPAHVGGDR